MSEENSEEITKITAISSVVTPITVVSLNLFVKISWSYKMRKKIDFAFVLVHISEISLSLFHL